LSLPSHFPSQVVPAPLQAGRVPWGAPVTALHVPGVTSQASHSPLQAWSQQWPSTQKVLVHWSAAVQSAPSASLATHAPPEQYSRLPQSASVVQLVLHEEPLAQANPPGHWFGLCCWHAPAPSHALSVRMPFLHTAPHRVLVPGYVQAVRLVPLQVPPQVGPLDMQACRVPCGAKVTGEHVPDTPFTSQASHWPVQAVLQQYPSTQRLLVHWVWDVHEAPMPSVGTQLPFGVPRQ